MKQPWKGKFTVCQQCGVKPVRARGLCQRCWQAQRRREKGIAYQGPRLYRDVKICTECGGKAWSRGLCRNCHARWWRSNSDQSREIEARRQNKLRFGGHEEILRRIEKGCERCGMTNAEHKKRLRARLHVHHIDHRGILSHEPNHDPQNLLILCAYCHRKMHAEERKRVSA